MDEVKEKDSTSNLNEPKKEAFSCNICLESPSSPVLTPCGHIFCWHCISNWLDMNHDDCPVCKGKVTKENVTPIYGSGNETKDPRTETDIPERPHAHYEESEHVREARERSGFFNNFSGMGGMYPGFVNMSFGNGSFMIGGGTPIFLIVNILFWLYKAVRRWISNRNRSTSTSTSEVDPTPQDNTSSTDVTGNNNEATIVIAIVVVLLIISLFSF